MVGWIYFITCCYIVTTVAKLITKGINYLIKKVIRFVTQRGPGNKTDLPKEAIDVH